MDDEFFTGLWNKDNSSCIGTSCNNQLKWSHDGSIAFTNAQQMGDDLVPKHDELCLLVDISSSSVNGKTCHADSAPAICECTPDGTVVVNIHIVEYSLYK